MALGSSSASTQRTPPYQPSSTKCFGSSARTIGCSPETNSIAGGSFRMSCVVPRARMNRACSSPKAACSHSGSSRASARRSTAALEKKFGRSVSMGIAGGGESRDSTSARVQNCCSDGGADRASPGAFKRAISRDGYTLPAAPSNPLLSGSSQTAAIAALPAVAPLAVSPADSSPPRFFRLATTRRGFSGIAHLTAKNVDFVGSIARPTRPLRRRMFTSLRRQDSAFRGLVNATFSARARSAFKATPI